MTIRDLLLQEHSKAQAEKILTFIGGNPQKFAELIEHLLGDNYRLSQRAAWPLSYSLEKYPELIPPHLKRLILNLRNPIPDAVKRNTLRFLQFIEIPEELMGEAADVCFEIIASAREPIAIKVFSMTVLHNLSQKEPDLKQELKILIEEQMPFGSAGFISRGKKILKAIRESQNN